VSRRRSGGDDPTGSKGTVLLLAEEVARALSALSERDLGVIRMRGGQVDGMPRTLREVAIVYGVSPQRIRQIEAHAVATLRQFLNDDHISTLSRWMQETPYPMPAESARPSWCDRHGWTVREAASTTCGNCPCWLPSRRTGRPRRYCSDACRQAASRAARRASGSNPDPCLERPVTDS
jgi:hypothetical protein